MGVSQLPGTKLTPTVLLNQVLERAEELKAVVVITIDNDERESTHVSNSCLTLPQMSLCSSALQERVHRFIEASRHADAHEMVELDGDDG